MEIYEYGNKSAGIVLIQPVDGHDLEMIEKETSAIRENTAGDFMLAAFKVDDWNKDLSPWTAPAVFGKEDFGEGAEQTLNEILKYCSDSSRTYYLGGYSLAGLFALWAVYRTDIFQGVAAVSPSMWFPGFDKYMKENSIKCKNVYLSLGDREEKTKNSVMATVGDRIREANAHLREQDVNCVLKWNEGNHFKEPELRTAKGFSHILLNGKLDRLKDYIRGLGSLAVGFSGGVDSTLLLFVAHEVLGDRAIAATSRAVFVPEREAGEAEDFCRKHGIKQFICRVNPLEIESCKYNHPDRCYHCKRMIFSEIIRIAKENGIEYVAEGSNMDDLGDYRPGLKAVEELKVTSPLRMAGLSKAEIRLLSKELGLPTWSKPAYACLASRFVYGEEITKEKLQMIDLAEQFLIENGFLQERVRLHGNLARIEVPEEDIPRLSSEAMRKAVYERFREIGFTYVSMDLQGYKVGSMNAVLD